jgi:hypothetical protein
MAMELKYNMGCRLGTFTSGPIKVISKASKAKTFTTNVEFKYLAVSSGQEVRSVNFGFIDYFILGVLV